MGLNSDNNLDDLGGAKRRYAKQFELQRLRNVLASFQQYNRSGLGS